MQERQRSWSAVQEWTSCRVQASFHVLSVRLEWAATASSAMAASTGYTRNAVGSSAWKKDPDYRCTRCQRTACLLDGRPQKEVQVGHDKLEVLVSFCYLGDMLSATTCVKIAWKKFWDLLPVHATLSKHVAMCTALVCGGQCSMPVRLGHWQSQTSSVCSEMTGQWSDRSAMSGRKTLSPPGPMSYLCGLAFKIWTSFWRREDSDGMDGMDMWNAPMVQSRQPLTYRLMGSVGLGGPRWHGNSWQRGIAESGSSRLATLMTDIPWDLVWDLQASYQEGGPLMWMLLLYRHVNQKSDYDMMISRTANKRIFFFFFFFDLGFTALSRIFHLYRADRSSKVGENRRTRRKTTWPSVSRTWLSHIWPERGSNHSGEKPNGLRVNSLIH